MFYRIKIDNHILTFSLQLIIYLVFFCGTLIFVHARFGTNVLIAFFLSPFFFAAISREDGEDSNHQHQLHHHHNHRGNSHGNKVSYNGYNSEEYLDRLETNGNIPANKSDLGYGKRK